MQVSGSASLCSIQLCLGFAEKGSILHSWNAVRLQCSSWNQLHDSAVVPGSSDSTTRTRMCRLLPSKECQNVVMPERAEHSWMNPHPGATKTQGYAEGLKRLLRVCAGIRSTTSTDLGCNIRIVFHDTNRFEAPVVVEGPLATSSNAILLQSC
jgi:hypothetical protein